MYADQALEARLTFVKFIKEHFGSELENVRPKDRHWLAAPGRAARVVTFHSLYCGTAPHAVAQAIPGQDALYRTL